MQPLLIDTHCHLDYEPLVQQAKRWLDDGFAQGITHTVIPATTAERMPALISLVADLPNVSPALGLHPIYLHEHSDEAIAQTVETVTRNRPIAIGEVGLDYFVETLDRERQQKLFEQMIALAAQQQLPLILHVRRSHDAVIQTLKRLRFSEGGIVHAFAGSVEQAREFIKLGFALGFGGVMTYSSATRVRRLASELPLSAIVLETDAPDMKPADWPEPHNTPLALLQNFAALCDLRSEPADVIAHTTTANAQRVLHLA